MRPPDSYFLWLFTKESTFPQVSEVIFGTGSLGGVEREEAFALQLHSSLFQTGICSFEICYVKEVCEKTVKNDQSHLRILNAWRDEVAPETLSSVRGFAYKRRVAKLPLFKVKTFENSWLLRISTEFNELFV